MQPVLDQVDEKILKEYPIPLALKYQQVLMQEDSFAKTRALTAALEVLLKYCLCFSIQDSYRSRLSPIRFSPSSIEQMLNLKASSMVKLLTETLFLFRRSKDVMFESELYLFIYEDFSETPKLRTNVSGILQALVEFAERYPYRGAIDSNEFECETDFQNYFPLLKGLYSQAVFLAYLPLIYFHDPMDELEAIEQGSSASLVIAENLMGVQAIAQAMAARRLPGAPFGRIALRSRRSNLLLSLHPLLVLVETIELLSAKSEDTLPIGPHVVIFYDEIRGEGQGKLLHYWQANLSKIVQNLDAPKLTITSQGGILNRLTDWIKTNRSGIKNRLQLAQQISKYIEQRNFTAAITEFKKISESEPDNLAIAARLGELCLSANQRQEAGEIFLKIAERCMEDGFIPQAMLMYQRVSKLNPKDINTSLKLANVCSEQGCQEIALQQCERIIDYTSQVNDIEGSLKALELAVRTYPDNYNNQRRLANIYLAKNQKQQALKCLLVAGEILYSQQLYQLAAEVYEDVLKIKPLHQVAFAMLGYIYLELGENEKAIEMLVPSCQSDPNDTNLLNALLQAYLSLSDIDKAYKTFSKLFNLDQNYSDKILEICNYLVALGELDKINTFLEPYINILISQHKERQVISLLDNCLAKDPYQLSFLRQLANIYEAIKDEASLKRQLQRLVMEARSQSRYEEAKTALRQLNTLDPRNPSYIAQLKDLERIG